MTENTTPKQNPFAPIGKALNRYKTPILATVAVTSITLNVVQNKGIRDLNAFLKEQGLFDTFYDMATAEAN
jgi:hypothetical protein